MRARVWIWLLLGGALVVLAAAVTFGESDQAHRLAQHADQLARSERVLSSLSTTRSNLGISVVLARTADLDPSLSAGADEARSVTLEAADRLLSEATALAQSSDQLGLSPLITSLEETTDAFARSGTDTTLDTAAIDFVESLDDMETVVVEFRNLTAAQVEAEGGRAGGLARVASYTVGLLAPAIALLAFRRISQQRIARLRREEELRRREEIAAAKVDLVAGLSHELRTPLTGIHGFSYTLIDMLDGPGDPEERPLLREIAGMMVEQTSDLSRMVDDLISFMRISDGTMTNKPVPVAVAEAAEAVMSEFAAQGVQSIVEPSLVECDPIHLRQMIRNLVSNAVKHGGAVVEVRGSVETDSYVVTVADDGPGLDPDGGDPFAAFAHEGTAPLTAGSLGMGLGVVKGLADISRGTITYRREGGWTCFDLRLPSSVAKADQAEDHVFAERY